MLITAECDPLGAVRATGGDTLAARLARFDANPATTSIANAPRTPLHPVEADEEPMYDVVLLGGGLSVLLAPLLAHAGLQVAVCERQTVGQAQREWNASYLELQALVRAGLLDHDQLDKLIVARYRHGICRWHGGDTQLVRGVLDCAVDAAGLLAWARERAVQAGVHLLEGSGAGALAPGPHGVRVDVQTGGRFVTARVVLDGRGAQSPYATADLVCPTVGGVIEGLRQGPEPDSFDPTVGEILVTTEGVSDGHQHLWEAFPGRDGQLTVYLFYYARRCDVAPGALQDLYRRFFRELPRYKKGAARLVRPAFGFIPGWSRQVPAPRSPHGRVVLLGDAAARHSALTFCGFGAMLRSLHKVVAHSARLCAMPARRVPTRPQTVVDDRPLHTATGGLALLLASPPEHDPNALNALLNAAFGSLAALGNDAFAALLQDNMQLRQFLRFLVGTSARRPEVFGDVHACLGPRRTAAWLTRLAGASLRDMVPL